MTNPVPILVIDDEIQIRRLLLTLERAGYTDLGPTFKEQTQYLRNSKAQLRKKLEEDP